MSGNGSPVFNLDCGGVYVFSYEKEINFLEFLRDPDSVKQQVMLEVMERLDNTIKTMEDILVEWGKRRTSEPAQAPVNSVVTPKMEQ